MLNASGVTRAEDLIKLERKSLADFQKRMRLGHHYAGIELEDCAAFSIASPLPKDT